MGCCWSIHYVVTVMATCSDLSKKFFSILLLVKMMIIDITVVVESAAAY